ALLGDDVDEAGGAQQQRGDHRRVGGALGLRDERGGQLPRVAAAGRHQRPSQLRAAPVGRLAQYVVEALGGQRRVVGADPGQLLEEIGAHHVVGGAGGQSGGGLGEQGAVAAARAEVGHRHVGVRDQSPVVAAQLARAAEGGGGVGVAPEALVQL